MRYTNFPRNRDEWLEPPDSDSDAEYIENYISENFTEITNGIFYDHEEETLVTLDAEEFEVDCDGDVSTSTYEPDPEEIFELAVNLIKKHIIEGSDE